MSKERLERIKERVNYHDHLDDDIEFLIEQAERVQELEQQNNRYREALEKISAPIDKVTYAYMFAVKQIARQVKHWRVKNDR